MVNKRFGALSSSVDPNELSLTVVSGVKLVLTVLATFGWVTVTQASGMLELVPAAVGAGYAAWSALQTLWGLARKVLVLFEQS